MVAAAIGTAAAVGGIATIGSSVISSNAAKSAAKTESEAADRAAQSQADMYNQTVAREQPFVTSGTQANQALSDQLGISGNTSATGYGSLAKPFDASTFTADPGYQFSLDQGRQALERSAAAGSGVLSGAAAKAIQTYGQGTAAQEYSDVYNRYTQNQNSLYSKLSGVSTQGQNAAGNLGTLGQAAATQEGNDLTSGASATAAGQVASANALTSGLTSLLGPQSNVYNYSTGLNPIQNVGATYPTQSGAIMGMMGA